MAPFAMFQNLWTQSGPRLPSADQLSLRLFYSSRPAIHAAANQVPVGDIQLFHDQDLFLFYRLAGWSPSHLAVAVHT
jgi:hypothetical protein